MNKGSKRVTVRLGDDLIELIEDYLRERLERAGCEPQNMSDFIVTAIADKLNHVHRSRRCKSKVTVDKIEEYLPRLVIFDQE
jgi:type II secretory pathway predicted ATPase ExeA